MYQTMRKPISILTGFGIILTGGLEYASTGHLPGFRKFPLRTIFPFREGTPHKPKLYLARLRRTS